MIVEHEFVTTLDPTSAMSRLTDFLSERGFTSAGATPFAPVMHQSPHPLQPVQDLAESAGWTTVEMRRGRKKPKLVKRISELPQFVRAEYDRGRVEVAVRIEPYRKQKPVHERFGRQVAETVESLLAFDGASAESVRQQWNDAEAVASAELRRKKLRHDVTLWTFLIILVALLVFAITMAVMNA